jgi:hypothetical protein
VVEGLRNDNLTKVIMEALMIGGGLPSSYALGLMISIYFKTPKMVLQNKSGTIMFLIP